MKQLFFLFGLSAISLAAWAQQQGEQHLHTGDKFGVSVFANSHTLHPEQRADKGVYAKLSAQFPTWYIVTDRWTGGFKDLNGKPISVSGATLEDKTKNLMNGQLAVAGINAAEWKLESRQTTEKGFTYLYFYQAVAGNKVAFTKMHFKFTSDGKIARIEMKGFGAPNLSVTPSFAKDKALDVAIQNTDGAIFSSKNIDNDWEWFPIPSSKGFTLHPAYKFTVEGKVQDGSSIPLNLNGYVDAVTGALLYRDNEVKDVVDLRVVGSIYTDGILNARKLVGLPNLTAKVGAVTLLANDTGYIFSSSIAMPATLNISLEGRWSRVRSAPDANATPAFSKIVTALGGSDSFNTASKSSSRHINAYYHVNTVHDFMKGKYGASFTGMDYALVTNVDITPAVCNAFFTGASGSSINFYAPTSGCVPFSELRDVVYHEYGHAIVSRMYSGGMRNGGLNEGQADIWAMSITKDSIMAKGSNGTPSGFIRRYDIDPKVYPADLVGQVHADGEIIAGAWWDYGRNVGNVDTMSQLFAEVLLTDRPDGPNGTEGEVYYDMLMSALINDDNDLILSNGTPHFTEIVKAFAKHGIYLLQDIDIAHNELAHQPQGALINVNAKLSVSNPSFFKNLNLVYRTSRATSSLWTTLPMVDAGGFDFSAQIPAQAEGTIVDYYFSAEDIVNNVGVFFPYNYYPISFASSTKVTLNYQFGVGLSRMRTIDFETTLDPTWQLGISTDNATSGKWIQAVPIASSSFGRVSQTGSDHTTQFGKCLVTGNASATFASATSASVKNGTTTVVSPLYDLSVYTNPVVEYYRWYGNDRGANPKKETWRVQMTAGSIFAKDVDNTNQSDFQWRRRIFKPFELFTGATKMQLKFIAVENPPAGGSNGLVEAAIDDIVIYEGVAGLTSSIKETPKELAKIYPNPASNILFIILPSASYQELSISFYDMAGKIVSSVPITKGAAKYAVETKGMMAGQYLVVIHMDKTIQTHKVTIAQ